MTGNLILCIYIFSRPSIPTKIYVGNLPETCRRTDLLETFEKFGKVVECDIVKNYAFVVSIIYPNSTYVFQK